MVIVKVARNMDLIEIKNAPTNRSKCFWCKERIYKGQLIGRTTDVFGNKAVERNLCPKCTRKSFKRLSKEFDIAEKEHKTYKWRKEKVLELL
jgi:hypothetical protein